MTKHAEPAQVKLTVEANAKLRQLKDDGYFLEMADGFRFAVALALAEGKIADQGLTNRNPVYSVSTIDPDRKLYAVVSSLRLGADEPVYHTVERLAEWGINELVRRGTSGTIDFGAMFPKSLEEDRAG